MEKPEIESLAKKYARRLLTKLEELGILNSVVRKYVLDEMNNLARELSNNNTNK
jgi:hypothetical protein